MKVLYLDCFSGIAGDMTVGALCDLGVKPSTLEWELSKLEIGDFHMHFERARRQNVEGTKFSIHEGSTHTHEHDEAGEHDHQHSHEEHAHPHEHERHHGHEEHCHGGEHSHGAEHGHEPAAVETEHLHLAHEPACGSKAHRAQEHDHDHGDEVLHEHPHRHDAGEHEHSHPHAHGRTHAQIRALIEAADLSGFVKEHALSIFHRIAAAEGKIHGMPPADVAFHEVGALDSIADIVCVCAGIEALGVERVHVSSLHEGRGWIDCAHGRFPIPAPATLEILTGIPIAQIDEPHELITPTGAAILAEFGASFGLMPRMTIEKIGYGIGSRDLASRPNVLRAVLGELVE